MLLIVPNNKILYWQTKIVSYSACENSVPPTKYIFYYHMKLIRFTLFAQYFSEIKKNKLKNDVFDATKKMSGFLSFFHFAKTSLKKCHAFSRTSSSVHARYSLFLTVLSALQNTVNCFKKIQFEIFNSSQENHFLLKLKWFYFIPH